MPKSVDSQELSGAQQYLPPRLDLTSLQRAASGCRGCTLYQDATSTVFGRGDTGAPLMLVGEQPGDQEDQAGQPFVGPAGRLLQRALAEAEVDAKMTYQTNAVKHFRFKRVGKRRIHEKPGRTEVVACRPWLIAEIEVVRPHVVLCLGATAAQSLLGSTFRVTAHRGEVLPLPGALHLQLQPEPVLMATVHPSALLRDRSEHRQENYQSFVEDLRRAFAAGGRMFQGAHHG
ncbi:MULTISPECIES: UdgX family uracil-DNA binding protein [Mycobacterium]|uniref:Type-4 uracil-DNA glycosylase n=1 Tax=Mycobacterium kiyosense TaxID=2871094 RepID=A0A9P3UVA0_9MYCO|nr:MULTISPECIES: UdgX family uracil-DNA binding protein [Mycobacterium]BDB42339.1 uracil-DNA glycosylase [Mycobacterium kiyosense]BDE14390.1 uracil-DNA glycosylase [Mycobacterium sp. 20KCMC460]GLB83266.1 uracil-DNA glycosylase [Mycobacterium kiyosense]GLB91230.1 uracil-DNA glycosylase [Mycobacterium kiyosense]GLB97882.1 uracil-DNA glycosylase [Mycobacterium kiyosense]